MLVVIERAAALLAGIREFNPRIAGSLVSTSPGDTDRASPLHLLDEALCAAV
jgi:hypothetical protein